MTADTSRVAKFETLETRVAAAMQRLGELGELCRTLTKKNAELEQNLAELAASNAELTSQIAKMEAERAKTPDRAIDNKKILHRIDRMLEKFGELQI
jgi:septal ring factor EnvC (AmiA/AmiB activator)